MLESIFIKFPQIRRDEGFVFSLVLFLLCSLIIGVNNEWSKLSMARGRS